MKMPFRAIAVLMLLATGGLTACDQAQDLANEAVGKAKQDLAAEAEKVKQGVVAEIDKAVNGEEQKAEAEPGKEEQEGQKEQEGQEEQTGGK